MSQREPWDTIKEEWRRKADTTVAIKILKVANGMTSLELSNEIKCNLKHNSLFINRVYGVTKEPSTQEYAVVTQFQDDKKHDTQLVIEIYYSQLRPPIPDYVPKQCKEIMERCWKHHPEDRPTATKLSELFYDWYKILKGEYPRYNPNLLKSDIEKEFSIEKEEEWKKQLAKLANFSIPLKMTHQSYTSKHLDFTKILSQQLQSSKYTFDSEQQNLDLADFEPE
ncbi:4172_t:CDS:2, partial [Cetraspora pellucida]